MIDLLVSIFKWGTERQVSRLRKDENKKLELTFEKEVFLIPPLIKEGTFSSAISWRTQVPFNDMMMSALY
jgi:hypothetical protein